MTNTTLTYFSPFWLKSTKLIVPQEWRNSGFVARDKQQIDRMTHPAMMFVLQYVLDHLSFLSGVHVGKQPAAGYGDTGSGVLFLWWLSCCCGNRLWWLWCDAVTAAARLWVRDPGRSSLGWVTQSDLRGELRMMILRDPQTLEQLTNTAMISPKESFLFFLFFLFLGFCLNSPLGNRI